MCFHILVRRCFNVKICGYRVVASFDGGDCNLALLVKSNMDNGAREFASLPKVSPSTKERSTGRESSSQHKQRNCDLKTAQYFNILRTLILLLFARDKNKNDYGSIRRSGEKEQKSVLTTVGKTEKNTKNPFHLT